MPNRVLDTAHYRVVSTADIWLNNQGDLDPLLSREGDWSWRHCSVVPGMYVQYSNPAPTPYESTLYPRIVASSVTMQ